MAKRKIISTFSQGDRFVKKTPFELYTELHKKYTDKQISDLIGMKYETFRKCKNFLKHISGYEVEKYVQPQKDIQSLIKKLSRKKKIKQTKKHITNYIPQLSKKFDKNLFTKKLINQIRAGIKSADYYGLFVRVEFTTYSKNGAFKNFITVSSTEKKVSAILDEVVSLLNAKLISRPRPNSDVQRYTINDITVTINAKDYENIE